MRTDPDQRDASDSDVDVDMLKRFVARVFPGLVPEPAVVETCMYTVGVAETSRGSRTHR